jgi:hypothetical protein
MFSLGDNYEVSRLSKGNETNIFAIPRGRAEAY